MTDTQKDWALLAVVVALVATLILQRPAQGRQRPYMGQAGGAGPGQVGSGGRGPGQ